MHQDVEGVCLPVGLKELRVDRLARAGDEAGFATRAGGADQIPAVGGDHDKLLGRDAPAIGGVLIRGAPRFVACDRIDAEDGVEGVAQPGAVKLMLDGFERAVGQGRQPIALLSQFGQGRGGVRVRRQGFQRLHQSAFVLFADRDVALKACPAQRAARQRAEGLVAIGQRGRHPELFEHQKPLCAHRFVAEKFLEKGGKCRDVQHGFVDIEYCNHGRLFDEGWDRSVNQAPFSSLRTRSRRDSAERPKNEGRGQGGRGVASRSAVGVSEDGG